MAKHRKQHPRGVLVEGYVISEHPLYHTYANMLYRCLTPTSTSWKNYGGQGITVCDRWRDFSAFVSDMGPKPSPVHSLERKNNDKGYEPDNCVWATRSTQTINRRRFESNTSGATGIVETRSGKFEVRFAWEGVRRNLGRYETLAEATAVRYGYMQGFFDAKGGLHG